MGAEVVEMDKDPQTVIDSRLIERFEVHREFTRVFLDAFILINSERKIIKHNQMFCTVLGLRAIDIRRARTIDDLMTLEIPGQAGSPMDMVLQATGPQRIDEVQARKKGTPDSMQLIISSFPYFDDDGRMLGACVLMRDVTAESNLQHKFKERTLMSITDPLTGLFTRRYFEEWIDKELERCKQRNLPPALGVLMFDLDKFKSVNDTYGHQAGDFVLSETSKVLKENSRKSDVLGRYGGEELLVLLLGSSARGVCVAAEKFRSAIASHEFMFEGQRIPVTTSIGATLFLDCGESREHVLSRADKCLYKAKHNGRNVVYADFGSGETLAQEIIDKEDGS